ncbi:hypothetical protein HK096_010916, partial [Nowakowskiella sp. JEL0078]
MKKLARRMTITGAEPQSKSPVKSNLSSPHTVGASKSSRPMSMQLSKNIDLPVSKSIFGLSLQELLDRDNKDLCPEKIDTNNSSTDDLIKKKNQYQLLNLFRRIKPSPEKEIMDVDNLKTVGSNPICLGMEPPFHVSDKLIPSVILDFIRILSQER